MVREFIKNKKISRTNYTAAAAVRVGMGVVADDAAKTFGLPAAETADNIVVVHKERVPYGVDAARTDFSDYEEIFQTVAKDEYGKLMGYEPGDVFGTDAVAATAPAAGEMVSVGTDGLWKKATVASRYKCIGEVTDCGHKLTKIVVLDAAVKNA